MKNFQGTKLIIVLMILLNPKFFFSSAYALSLGSCISFSLLNKLYTQFSSLSSLNCESCQFAKHPSVHLSPKVNKRANAPFELVHSDV